MIAQAQALNQRKLPVQGSRGQVISNTLCIGQMYVIKVSILNKTVYNTLVRKHHARASAQRQPLRGMCQVERVVHHKSSLCA